MSALRKSGSWLASAVLASACAGAVSGAQAAPSEAEVLARLKATVGQQVTGVKRFILPGWWEMTVEGAGKEDRYFGTEDGRFVLRTDVYRAPAPKIKGFKDNVRGISRAEAPGLVQMLMGDPGALPGVVLYTGPKAEFIAGGQLLDYTQRKDLTAEYLAEAQRVDWKELPRHTATRVRIGTGAREIAVFMDPLEGYSKRFFNLLAKTPGAVVYVFWTPFGEAGAKVAQNVVCADDPPKVFLALVLKNVQPPDARACKTPIEEHKAYARSITVNGSPTLLFPDGSRIPGVPSPEKMKELFE